MQMRGLIRVLGGFMSFAAVVFGHKVATSATVISTNGSVVPNLSNLKVAVESTGASFNWGCIPMISGKSQPGYYAKQLNCSNMIDSAMVVEYTDKIVPEGGNVESGYASVTHQYCLGPQYHGSAGLYRAWACFCNATGLCAPVRYLAHMGYDSGDGTYGTARYYTMEQWMAGIKETAGSGTGTGAGTGSVPTGSWGGYPSGAADWGRFYNQDEDGFVYLRYPVEVFNVAMSGCADGYYATTLSGTGTAQITVTALMTTASLIDNSYADSNSFEAVLGLGTPRYDYIGSELDSRLPVGSEWAVCSNSCPNASSTNTTLSGYSGTFYNDLNKYSVGYKCAADVSFTDSAGTFTMTGCVGSF